MSLLGRGQRNLAEPLLLPPGDLPATEAGLPAVQSEVCERRARCIRVVSALALSISLFAMGAVVAIAVQQSAVLSTAGLPLQLNSATGASAATAPAGSGGAFVHLFEWDWPSVAAECEQWLAPKGFHAVQISPPQEHIQGDAWFTRYQPVSYKLVSRSGDEEQFIDMIQRCNRVGVKVIIDGVINHMAIGSGVGVAGSPYSDRDFPAAGYTPEDFHHQGDLHHNCIVTNYTSKANVQTCDLNKLPDLCTGCSKVRDTLVAYMRRLLTLGSNVGFRIDAAKHQDERQLRQIIKEAGWHWNFQEVIYGDGEAVHPDDYIGNGLVTEFRWASKVAARFKGKHDKFKTLDTAGEEWGMLPSSKVVTFTDNHDTQRAPGTLTYKDGKLYYLFVVFTLATPYGYPKVLSSFAFDSADQGPPAYPANRCSDRWMCEHRRPEVANMIEWRRVAGRGDMEHVHKDDSGDHFAFGRGSAAFLAMNRGEEPWEAVLQTGMAAGVYCDVIQSDDPDGCPTVAVDSSGLARISVQPLSAVAFHVKEVQYPLGPVHV